MNWRCEICTLVNGGEKLECGACGSSKPNTAVVNMAPNFHNPTLAQLRGLAPKPAEKLSRDEWHDLEFEAIKRGDAGGICSICHEDLGTDEQVILR